MVGERAVITDASLAQQRALAIVPKVSSGLSFLCSLYIVADVIRLPRDRRRLYHRILLGMSLSDCCATSAWFFSTWPIDPAVQDVWGARGNQRTCTAQGFFAQFRIATVLYSGYLGVYYFLVIRRGWSHAHLRESKIEYLMHPTAVGMALGTSTASVVLGLFNPLSWDCWIASVPLGCEESWLHQGETDCERGDNATLFAWAFFYIPLWIVIGAVTVVMISIVWRFYVQERLNEVHRRQAVGKNQSKVLRKWSNSKLHQIIWQSIFYVSSFYLAWTFPTVLRIAETAGYETYYHWVQLSAAFMPTQGMWNFVTYLRPRFIHLRKKRRREQTRLDVGSTPVGGATQQSTENPSDVEDQLEQESSRNGGLSGMRNKSNVSFAQTPERLPEPEQRVSERTEKLKGGGTVRSWYSRGISRNTMDHQSKGGSTGRSWYSRSHSRNSAEDSNARAPGVFLNRRISTRLGALGAELLEDVKSALRAGDGGIGVEGISDESTPISRSSGPDDDSLLGFGMTPLEEGSSVMEDPHDPLSTQQQRNKYQTLHAHQSTVPEEVFEDDLALPPQTRQWSIFGKFVEI